MTTATILLTLVLILVNFMSKSVCIGKLQEYNETYHGIFNEEPALFMLEASLESLLDLALSSYPPQDANGAVQFLSNFTKFLIPFQNYWAKSLMAKVGRYNRKHQANRITLWVYANSIETEKVAIPIYALREENALNDGTVSMFILRYAGLTRETIPKIQRDVQFIGNMLGNLQHSTGKRVSFGVMFDKINCHPANKALIEMLNLNMIDTFIFSDHKTIKFDQLSFEREKLGSNRECENIAPRDKIVRTMPLVFDINLHPFHYDPLAQRRWSLAKKDAASNITIIEIMHAKVIGTYPTINWSESMVDGNNSNSWLERPPNFHPQTFGVTVDISIMDNETGIGIIWHDLFLLFSKINLKISFKETRQVKRLMHDLNVTPRRHQYTPGKVVEKSEITLTAPFPDGDQQDSFLDIDKFLSEIAQEDQTDMGKIFAIIFEWESCSRPNGAKRKMDCNEYLDVLEHLQTSLRSMGGPEGYLRIKVGIALSPATVLDFLVLFSSSQFRERALRIIQVFHLCVDIARAEIAEKGSTLVSQSVARDLVQYEDILQHISGVSGLNVLYSVRVTGFDTRTYDNITIVSEITAFWEHLSEWSASKNKTLLMNGALMIPNIIPAKNDANADNMFSGIILFSVYFLAIS